jgi:hypothetical protein
MHHSRIVCLAIIVAAYAAWPPVKAQNPLELRVPQMPTNDSGKANQIRDMGATYHALETNVRRVRTKFQNAEAIAERDLDGVIRTVLTTSGNESIKISAHGKELRVTRQGSIVVTPARDGVVPTLDWLNTQAYAIVQDNPDQGQGLEWQQKYLRARGKQGGDLEDSPLEIAHEYNDGVVAMTKHNTPPKGSTAPHLSRNFATEILKDGVRVGQMRYYVDAQAFYWDLPGLTKGKINRDTEQLGRGKKGWPFRPTQAWANVQAYAFYTMHSKLKAEGRVASSAAGKGGVPKGTGGCAAPTSLVSKVLDAFAPTLYAQDGCTGLHYLDNSVYRPCCDRHDACYNKNGCGWYSWFYWPMSPNWLCNTCNMTAFTCFVSGSTEGSCDCCAVGFSCCNPFYC